MTYYPLPITPDLLRNDNTMTIPKFQTREGIWIQFKYHCLNTLLSEIWFVIYQPNDYLG